jgi:hypothetical protein
MSVFGQTIKAPELATRVKELLQKYDGDRKKKIMIEWSRDKILEHQYFMQLNGDVEVRSSGGRSPPLHQDVPSIAYRGTVGATCAGGNSTNTS